MRKLRSRWDWTEVVMMTGVILALLGFTTNAIVSCGKVTGWWE